MAKTRKGPPPFGHLSQPAQQALAAAGITSLAQLSRWTEKAVLQLHGMGKASLPPLREALAEKGFLLLRRTKDNSFPSTLCLVFCTFRYDYRTFVNGSGTRPFDRRLP